MLIFLYDSYSSDDDDGDEDENVIDENIDDEGDVMMNEGDVLENPDEEGMPEDVGVPDIEPNLDMVVHELARIGEGDVAESVAQADDEANAEMITQSPPSVIKSPAPTSPEQPKVSSPKAVSVEHVIEVPSDESESEVDHLRSMVAKLLADKEILTQQVEAKREIITKFRETQAKNKEVFDELVEQYEDLSDKYQHLNVDYDHLKEDYDLLKQGVRENTPEASSSDKEFVPDEVEEEVGVSDTPREISIYYTRSRRSARQPATATAEAESSSLPVPDEALTLYQAEKAEGKRKLDAIPEITESAPEAKKPRIEEVQKEPILVDLSEFDDDWYNEVVDYEDEPDATVHAEESLGGDEIPLDIEERFEYLVKKYNGVFLDGLTIPQVNEEYEKCKAAEAAVPADPNAIIAEEGEWDQACGAIIVNDIPEEYLRHEDTDYMPTGELKS